MNDLKLTVYRNQAEDPNDIAGIQRYHEERAKLLHGLIEGLDLEVKGGIYDVAEGGRPREIAEVIIALGTAGAFTAMVKAFQIWLDRNKIPKVTIEGSGGTFEMSGATAADVEAVAKAVGVTLAEN